jgi:hypothetical protein
MPAHSGKFQYLDDQGNVVSQGPCQFRFDAETAIVTPSGATPIAFDLGDVDRAVAGEWDFALTLFTGRRVLLRQFGAAFERMSQELVAAWRDRTVRCLLLEDLTEAGRYPGVAGMNGPATAAEIRLYRSNIAVLPLDGAPIQWRLAEVDAISFDDATYTISLQRGSDRLSIGKLAKKTDEFRGRLSDALDALHTHEAEALHTIFPFLNPDQLQLLLVAMPEGRSVPLASLGTIHPQLPEALTAHAVSPAAHPYFDALKSRAPAGGLMTGYKFIRPDEADETPGGDDEKEEADTLAQPLFFWFFFPLANGRVAWEATTGSGRATYFFDAPAPMDQSIASLTRGLALVNFRREPVYLPDESLDRQQKFHRYAIGARKLPDLRKLRASFRGRAIHTNLEAWTAQVQAATSS